MIGESMRINLKLEDPELTSYMEKYPQKLRAEITRKLMYIAILLEGQGGTALNNLMRENDRLLINAEPEEEAEPEKDLGELLGIEALLL